MKKAIQLIFITVFADQALKMWVRETFILHEQRPFLSPLLELVYVQNRGASWGIFQGERWLLIGATILIMIWIFRQLSRNRQGGLCWSYSLLFAGALGNFIDRVWLGYVVDMFHFPWINFPVFNIADCALTFGVIGLMIWNFREGGVE